MSQIKNLDSQSEAFQPGAVVWMIADLESSRWAQKLDWYLNFQLRRSSLHVGKKISQSALEKMQSWGYEPVPAQKSAGPLMIDSHHLLPNRLTVQIPFREIEDWAKKCLKVLADLKLNSARIFLPKNLSASEFKKALGTKTSGIQFEIVEEDCLD